MVLAVMPERSVNVAIDGMVRVYDGVPVSEGRKTKQHGAENIGCTTL